MALRDYQISAIERIREHIRAKRRRILLVAPTGAGKTLMAGEIIRAATAKGNRTLAIAHRRELIDQLSDRLTREQVPHGIIAGERTHSTEEPVLVASIQTLARRKSRPAAGIVLVDEAHHAAAATYRTLLDDYPGACVIGLTASPWRLDGKGLAEIFDEVVVAATPKELIAQGYLCSYEGRRFEAPSLDGINTSGGDYDEGELSLAYEKSSIFGDVIAKWQKYGAELSTIVFAASISNSLALLQRFRDIGVTAEHIDYETPKTDRAKILARVRSGETRVICNVNLLTEGIDIPRLKCCIMARPTKSLALYLQMVGRVMRPLESGDVAWILDHSENVQRHGLPDMDRDYSLTQDKEFKPPDPKTCGHCMAVVEAWSLGCICDECQGQRTTVGVCATAGCDVRSCRGLVCGKCGYKAPEPIPTSRGGPGEVDDHVDVDIRAPLPLSATTPIQPELTGLAPPPATREQQVAVFEQFLTEALRRGRRPGYAVHRFRERFPEAPLPWGVWRRLVGKPAPT